MDFFTRRYRGTEFTPLLTSPLKRGEEYEALGCKPLGAVRWGDAFSDTPHFRVHQEGLNT